MNMEAGAIIFRDGSCCGFNGTYATGTYARNQYIGKIKM